MKIKDCDIQQFGKLRDRSFTFDPGINVIYGPNESGKSTLHGFFRSMFFGLDRYRGRASKTDPYSRYEPWERPAEYGGSLRMDVDGKTFYLERNFYKNDKRERLICEDDGEQLSLEQGDLEVLLGDLGAAAFDNTVSIGQLRARTDDGLVAELERYMANYEGGASSDLDVRRGLERLQKKKKEWEKKEASETAHWEEQQADADGQIAFVEEELQGLEKRQLQLQEICEDASAQRDSLRESVKHLRRKLEEAELSQTEDEELLRTGDEKISRTVDGKPAFEQIEDEETSYEENARYPLALLLLGIAAVIGGAAFGIYMKTWSGLVLAGAGILLAGWSQMLYRLRQQEMLQRARKRQKLALQAQRHHMTTTDTARAASLKRKEKELQEQEQRLQDVEKQFHRTEGQLELLEQQLEEKRTTRFNLREMRETLNVMPEEVVLCRREVESLTLAQKTLQSLSGDLQQQIGRTIRERMGEILSEITEGRYSRVLMDENWRISLMTDNRVVPLYQLSSGTVEQVYFALRMAAADVLCSEPMPVFLDEVFSSYDNERLGQVLRWLDRQGRQVLIFTCHRRESRLLAESKTAFCEIRL